MQDRQVSCPASLVFEAKARALPQKATSQSPIKGSDVLMRRN
jgi:hypothetical protein